MPPAVSRSVRSSGPAAPRDLFAGVLPGVPTSLRDFSSGARATAFLQLYTNSFGRGTPILLSGKVTDADGASHHEEMRRVFIEGVGQNGADLQWPIPIDALAAGSYLFTVEARLDSTSVRREVRFSVRR